MVHGVTRIVVMCLRYNCLQSVKRVRFNASLHPRWDFAFETGEELCRMRGNNGLPNHRFHVTVFLQETVRAQGKHKLHPDHSISLV